MDMTLHDTLCAKIQNDMEVLDEMEVGSDTYRTAADVILKMADRAIEVEKIEADCAEKAAAREQEVALKNAQMAEEKKHRLVTHVLTAAGIIVPAVLTVWGTVKSFEFERDGTVTTILGRKLVGRCVPNK